MSANIYSSIVFCFALVTTGPAASAVYKHVDADGNITFSDTPPNPDAEELELEPLNIIPPADITPRPNTSVPAEDEEVDAYSSLAFSAPEHDVAIRENAGNVTFSLDLTPILRGSDGHQLVVKMDGVEVMRGATTSHTLDNVDRGSHKLSARVIDSEGNTLIEATPVVFHLQRVSTLN